MKILKLIMVTVVALTFVTAAQGAEQARSASIMDLVGSARVVFSNGERHDAEIGMVLQEGDALVTGPGAWLLLGLDGIEASTVELEENTRMLLSELVMDPERSVQKTMLDLAVGRILITAEKLHTEESNFRVKTPTSVVGVRGTVFAVEVEAIE